GKTTSISFRSWFSRTWAASDEGNFPFGGQRSSPAKGEDSPVSWGELIVAEWGKAIVAKHSNAHSTRSSPAYRNRCNSNNASFSACGRGHFRGRLRRNTSGSLPCDLGVLWHRRSKSSSACRPPVLPLLSVLWTGLAGREATSRGDNLILPPTDR